jgi:hypothetical protein
MTLKVSDNDIRILSSYKFLESNAPFNSYNRKNNAFLLAVSTKNGKEELRSISSHDATCWQRFLSLFNKGKLANTSLSLSSISTYLQKHDVIYLQDNFRDAFNTVCDVANRRFFCHHEKELMNRVSNTVQWGLPDIKGNVVQYKIFMNSRTNAYQVLLQLHKKNAQLLRKDDNGSFKKVNWNERISTLPALKELFIHAGNVRTKKISSDKQPVPYLPLSL